MMYIIKNAIYFERGGQYIKCILRKDKTGYYLVETKVVLDALPREYSVVTMEEVIARYGTDIADDSAMPSKGA